MGTGAVYLFAFLTAFQNVNSFFLSFRILTRLSQGSLDKKSVSLPPSTFFPSLYGYYKRPDDGIRMIRSEPSSKPKNIVSTFRTKVRFLPPIATLYPTGNEKDIS